MSSSPHDHDHAALPSPRTVEVSDGVFAYVQPDGSWWINNTGFIAGDSGVVAIDTCSTERRNRAYLAAIRAVTRRPVRTVVNTHHHGDHTHGNFLFQPAAVVGHERCREQVLAFGHARFDGVFTPIDFGDLEIEPPMLTFADRVDLYVDDLRIELHYIGGAAHTTNDVVAWIPDRSVLFAGDLVFNGGTPFVVMGSVSGSLDALARLEAFGAEVIVPGHGAPIDLGAAIADMVAYNGGPCAAWRDPFDSSPQGGRDRGRRLGEQSRSLAQRGRRCRPGLPGRRGVRRRSSGFAAQVLRVATLRAMAMETRRKR